MLPPNTIHTDMQAHTKKHLSENIRFIPEAISRLRNYARTTGATQLPTDSIPATELFSDLATNQQAFT